MISKFDEHEHIRIGFGNEVSDCIIRDIIFVNISEKDSDIS